MADDILNSLRSSARWIEEMEYESWLGTAELQRDAADEIQRLRAEIKRLRTAIDALLTDIDGDHRPEWSSDEAEAAGKKPWCCAWCGAADGGWPCVHRRALDELKEARRG